MNVATHPLDVATGRETWAFVLRLLVGRRSALVFAVAILMASAALGLVVPWGFGAMVDLTVRGGTLNEVLRIGALMGGAAAAAAALGGIGMVLAAQLFEKILAQLREQMVVCALTLPQAQVEAAGSGDVVSRATDDVSVVSDAVGEGVPALSASLFAVVASLVGFAALNWRFLIVVVVLVPFYYFSMRMYLKAAPPVYAAERAAMADRAHHLLGATRGLPTVQAFGLQEHARDRIGTRSWEVVRWSMRARIVQNRIGGRINTAEFIGMATILLVGFYLVRVDAITVGMTTTAMLLFLRLFGPIGALLFVLDAAQSGAASLSRIVGVINTARARTDTGSVAAPPPQSSPPELAAHNVTYCYPGAGDPVLENLTLTVKPGETVAVVGTSGAGKSTLAGLLAGLHTPQSGRVTVGSVPLAELPHDQVPVLLTQEVHVFSGTLAQDLRIAAPTADDDQIAAALRAVGAWEWVSLLPNGIETQVGASGHSLTPMREQQLALARIVLLDPPVVILDEATADADSSEADALEAAAQAALAGRTALVVAHRLSQAARADRVVVMEAGQVIENGTHDELRKTGGRYAQLWAAWSRHR